MDRYIQLRQDDRLLHEKMQGLIDLQAEILEEEYTTQSQILVAISSKLGSMLLESKCIFDRMEKVV